MADQGARHPVVRWVAGHRHGAGVPPPCHAGNDAQIPVASSYNADRRCLLHRKQSQAGLFQIRRRGDNHGVVPAQFKQAAAKAFRDAIPTRPMAQLPVALISGTRRSPTSCSPQSRPPINSWCRPLRAPEGGRPVRLAAGSHRRRHTRGFSDGFQTTVTTHQRDTGVPGPHGHREVKCRNHTRNSQRMPAFLQAMARAF